MARVAELAHALGVGPSDGTVGELQIVDAIQRGLPLSSLDTVAAFLSDDARFVYRIVPKASLARRKAANTLSPQESDRVARLARIWMLAREVWGEDGEARAFLDRPHPLLGDRRPLDLVVDSEMGAELVRDVLGRLQFGSAA
jgi:putative toxin-antitoxin system antitoxin component (TIGR02293 family)